MNWQSVGLIAATLSFLTILAARTLPGRRWAAWALWLGVGLLLYRWAGYRGAWPEVWVAAGLATIAVAAWWAIIGRRLPEPRDEIRVWREEKPFE